MWPTAPRSRRRRRVSSARRAARRRSCKRLIDGRAGLREEFRAVLGDVQAILEPDAELAVDRDHRLVAEAHAGLQRRLVAAHEVRPLVAVEADAVAGAMRQAGHLVAGAETGVGDHL